MIARVGTAILVATLIGGILATGASATDNVGSKWHWSGGSVWYRVAAYTLPSQFQPALDNAATKWRSGTSFKPYRDADIGNTNWADTSTHILWYGEMPSAWGCASTFIACTFVVGTDTANRHLDDVDTVWDWNDTYTNTCPWWPGADPDIESVFLHEFGHWGTLGHTADGRAVMRSSYSACLQTLTWHDIDSMNSVYVH